MELGGDEFSTSTSLTTQARSGPSSNCAKHSLGIIRSASSSTTGTVSFSQQLDQGLVAISGGSRTVLFPSSPPISRPTHSGGFGAEPRSSDIHAGQVRASGLYPVHPNSLDHYRKSVYPSGAKSNRVDAALVLDFLYKHPENLRPIRDAVRPAQVCDAPDRRLSEVVFRHLVSEFVAADA
jgi:hypothetical protein